MTDRRSQQLANDEPRVTYETARRRDLEATGWAFWVFRHDPDCQHGHVDLDGLVVPPDETFWVLFYPPASRDCGCYVLGARSERGSARLGGQPQKQIPDWACRQISDYQQAG